MQAAAQAEARRGPGERLGLQIDDAAAAVPLVGQTVLAQAVLRSAQGGKQLYDRHWETQMCFMAYDNRFPPRHVSLRHFNSSNPGLSPTVYAALLTPRLSLAAPPSTVS